MLILTQPWVKLPVLNYLTTFCTSCKIFSLYRSSFCPSTLPNSTQSVPRLLKCTCQNKFWVSLITIGMKRVLSCSKSHPFVNQVPVYLSSTTRTLNLPLNRLYNWRPFFHLSCHISVQTDHLNLSLLHLDNLSVQTRSYTYDHMVVWN